MSGEGERKFIFNLVTTPASGRGVITESSEKRSVEALNLCAAIRDAGLAIQCNYPTLPTLHINNKYNLYLQHRIQDLNLWPRD